MPDETTHTAEVIIKGIPASPGIAIGPAFLFHKQAPVIREKSIAPEETAAEVARLEQAVARSHKELRKILEFAQSKLGEDKAKIFEAQLMILEDAVLFDSVYGRIRSELKNAEFVVYDEIGKYHRMMLSAKDEYTRERAHDVEDVRNRILRNLQEERLISRLEGSSIIVSQNLTAADTLILSRNDVLGYVTDIGGVTSHTALLARALKIPAVVGARTISQTVRPTDRMIVDGYSGTIILNPSESTLRRLEQKREEFKRFEERLSELRELPAQTLDGHRVELSANVEFEQELEFTRLQGADGIGLYRSEVLLIGKEVFPTEEEQFEQYRLIVEAMYPQRVIIRTFDIGGDKLMVNSTKENNPFLGWRGIRVMLDKPELFLDQLRAILRASTRKNVSVMFPMVSSIKEVRSAKRFVEEAKDQLRKAGIPFDEKIKIGVMVEVPAAAVIAENLAKEVNFLSIGTNDLIQYLLAVDRGNDVVSGLYQEFHPAVLRFLRRIIERGKRKDVWVGMCGEMAGDPLATILLLGLGLDEFSVVPNVLPEIKKIIRSVKYKEAKKIAKHVMTLETEDEVKAYLRGIMKDKFPDIPTD
ncbi:MAG: phosphoenolpyruvate--protein phosphotransferase [Ignavibacteriales bacterium]|nr:phosphoenolpyruvate--protein phosphotransferase [Ignavibacteriales bacterium]